MIEIEHDPELVKRLAQMHEGNAKAHLRLPMDRREASDSPRQRWSSHDMLAASGLVVAASYWSMIAPQRAVLAYRDVAGIYRGMGHNYWTVLSLASASEREIDAVASSFNETPAPNPQALAFAMVGNEVSERGHREDGTERFSAQWRHMGNPSVGRLGIPLDHYGRCAQAMRAAHENKSRERFVDAAANFIRRAAEVIRTASHDRFHWRRLESTILPAEPEAIAMAVSMSVISHTIFQMPMTEITDLDAHGRLLVEIGESMRDAARDSV